MYFDSVNEIPNLYTLKTRLKRRGLEMVEEGE
jgi:hypothetical protein